MRPQATVMGFHEQVAAFEKELVIEALNRADGHVVDAAKMLKLSRHSLRYLMIKHGLGTPERKYRPRKVSPENQLLMAWRVTRA